MRLGRNDRNAQVLMDKRRAFFWEGIGNKEFYLGHDFPIGSMFVLIKLEVSGNNMES